MKTKIEPTQEEIFTSSDEADSPRREEEGGSLVTLAPDSFDLDDSKMERNRINDGSSDWSGRGSRSRGSSTV